MGKVSTFFHLDVPEKKIFFRAVYLLMQARIALRRQSFKTLVEQVSTLDYSTHLQPPHPIPVDRLMRLFAAACRSVPLTTCLSRALAGQRFLLRYGFAPVLHIGVAKEKTQNLEAHAWLTLEQEIILGRIPDLDRYQEIPLSSASRVQEK